MGVTEEALCACHVLVNWYINWSIMSDVFSFYRYYVNCLYALTTRNCTERVANFVFSYILIGIRPDFYDCVLGKYRLMRSKQCDTCTRYTLAERDH